MKTLIILLTLSGVASANDGANAFATGFANAMNVQMGGRPYTPPAQVQQVEVYQAPAAPVYDPHWDAVSFDNRLGGYYFFNERGCEKFLKRSNGQFTTCRMVY